ncbi:hypothetical protein ACJIZ3_009974 [Penstemon smallii]|uniref:Uncharacterized protein n=1 Tax=Penstemon smallii TaxID=265156 RepID=A0ABD3TFD2_9LAMI
MDVWSYFTRILGQSQFNGSAREDSGGNNACFCKEENSRKNRIKMSVSTMEQEEHEEYYIQMVHMKNVPTPCRVAKSIIVVPSHIWYLTEASNGTPSKRNKDSPLNTGSRRRARQASANKPQRVAILYTLYCHLKSGKDDLFQVDKTNYSHSNKRKGENNEV